MKIVNFGMILAPFTPKSPESMTVKPVRLVYVCRIK